VPLVSVGRSAAWVTWWSLSTVVQRIIFVWLYRVAGRSVGAVALSHALRNLVWMAIPLFGSEYDPRADTIVAVAVAVALVARGRARRD
jgi:membrane protease YdiL (CAAX protease family)